MRELPRGSLVGALVGRERELELIRSLIDRAADDGDALLLRGEPGVGKSVLLDAAAEIASMAGTGVLRAGGVEFEADVTFSGLRQVLSPLMGGPEFSRLSAVHRDVLSVALGSGDGSVADRLLVSTAALVLLQEAAVARPRLVVVDDVQWLDRSSAAVLGFVARRLAGTKIGLLAVSRSEAFGLLEWGGLPEHEIRPLDPAAAAELTLARFPDLAPRVRRRLLAEAEGNPLALLELPTALSGPQQAARRALPTVLPLTDRLQALFVSRVGELPAPTRQLMLLAAMEGSGELHVLAAAAPDRGLDDLRPAEQARLVRIDQVSGRMTFRHPLIRSAVVELSPSSERRGAHAALAELLADQPERRVWHLADASVEPDEEVAAQLEQVAHRIRRRGDAVGAVSALIRAAELSPGGSERARRLAEAAYIGADVTGELRNVSQLLVDARRADPTPNGTLEASVAAAYSLLSGDGDVETAHRLLVGAIENAAGPQDLAALPEALHTLMLVCLYGGRPELWEPFHRFIARLEPHVPLILSLCAKVQADPVRTSAGAIEPLELLINGIHDEVEPTRIVRIGIAALYLDRLAGCREALWRVVEDGRRGGAVTSALSALVLLSFDDLVTGDWEEARQLAAEAVALCGSHGYQMVTWTGQYNLALLAAVRGDGDTTRALTDEMIRWAAPRGVRAIQAYSYHARALAAIGRGDFELAYEQAAAISPPGTFASHVATALWVMLDLVEAAVRTDRRTEAAAHVAAMHEADIAALSSRLALLVAGSAAIVAPDDSASPLFEQALAVPGADRWPFELARVQLLYGECLHRNRAIAEARTHLTAALETFRRLRAQPWAARAGSELRAVGLARPRSVDLGPASLTPQEREIAQLAAAGLTNKEIARRIYLSHRTVGAILYRVFPKLGITSRAALRDALDQLPEGRFDDDPER